MKINEHTSICIFKCCLKLDKRVRKMASESSNTSGTELTPFLDRATHKYCLMAFINISLVLKTGPAFCRMDNRSCRDRTLDLSSCDLKKQWRKKFSKMKFCNDAIKHVHVYKCTLNLNIKCIYDQKSYFGSGGPSAKGFMESLHRLLNTRKASFCSMWLNTPCVISPSSPPPDTGKNKTENHLSSALQHSPDNACHLYTLYVHVLQNLKMSTGIRNVQFSCRKFQSSCILIV